MKRIIIAATAIAALLAPALAAAAPASAAASAVDNCSGSRPVVNVRGALLEVTSTNTVVATKTDADGQFWCMNSNSTGITFEEHGGVECLQVVNNASVVGNCNNSSAGWVLTRSRYSNATTSFFLLQNGQNCLYQNGIGQQLVSMRCQNVSGVTGDVWSYGNGMN